MAKCPILTTVEQSEQSLVYPFTGEEYRKGIATLKNIKAARIDDVLVEQLKHLGPRAHRCLHSMLNTCFTEKTIPKVWRQSRMIAILKPRERRFDITTNQEAGFRPGKSCAPANSGTSLKYLPQSRLPTISTDISPHQAWQTHLFL